MRQVLLLRLCKPRPCFLHNIKLRHKSSWSCRDVRSTFIDHFKSEGHRYVPSSSVIPPKGDGTYFTNAGMNQFKPIFLGSIDPSSKLVGLKRAVNSQKCIRIGGKHNDLEDVGQDLTHLTFFEMLGNWSFGDYFKEEACRMAFDLLTVGYNIPIDRLYFTYFGGDKTLGLPADEECRELWASLGIPRERILPFGSADNFWDMGATGPCGPCTEIHFDHQGNRFAPAEVNVGSPDLVEIWNLVFIQYDRQADQSLLRLPQQHVDTGMGLERITAALNGTRDNFETDAFLPLFSVIKDASDCKGYMGTMSDLDVAYRTLADHARMFTVAMSDGLVPSNDNLGHKLRGIIHRCIQLSRNVYKADPFLLLPQLASTVVSSLEDPYAELRQFHDKVVQVLGSTIEHHDTMHTQNMRSFKKMLTRVSPASVLPGDAILDLEIGRYGNPMSLEAVADLASQHSLTLDTDGYRDLLDKQQQDRPTPSIQASSEDAWSKSSLVEDLLAQSVPATDDSLKYFFDWDATGHDLAALTSRCDLCCILGMSHGGQTVQSVFAGQEGELVLDKTCFYAQSGGQDADCGILHSETGRFAVTGVKVQRGFVVHQGHVVEGHLLLTQKVTPQISQAMRKGNARNHTATHLLNSALLEVLPSSQQEGSNISAHRFTFDFLALSKISQKDIQYIELKVREVIKAAHSVQSQVVPLDVALEMPAVRRLQNEDYPNQVRVVSILAPGGKDLTSRELCGGTHVASTSDLEEFCITHLGSKSQNVKRATCVTGQEATMAHQNGCLLSQMCQLIENFVAGKGETKQKLLVQLIEEVSETLASLSHGQEVLHDTRDDTLVNSDGMRQVFKDIEKAFHLLTSLGSSIEQLLADPTDNTHFIQTLINDTNKARQLDLLSKLERDRAETCLETFGHKVSELINARHAQRLQQQIDSCLAPPGDTSLKVVRVGPKMNPRQLFKQISQKTLQQPMAFVQKGSSSWTLVLSLPGQMLPVKAKHKEVLEHLVETLSVPGQGSGRGKLTSRKDGSAVFSVGLKGEVGETGVVEALKVWVKERKDR